MAKSTGKKFEDLIKQSAEEQGIDYTRFKDAGFVGDKSDKRRFTPKNLCDCLLFANGRLYYLEAKSRRSALRFDEITQYKALMKKEKSLQESEKTKGAEAGLLIHFQKTGRYFYMSIAFLEQLKLDCGKKSFNANDMEVLCVFHPCFAYEIKTFIPPRKRNERLDLSVML